MFFPKASGMWNIAVQTCMDAASFPGTQKGTANFDGDSMRW